MQHLPVISRGIASSIPTPAQTCSQLFVQGLICLTALDDVVRAAAYRLLVAIVDSGKIACPDLPTLKGVLLRLLRPEKTRPPQTWSADRLCRFCLRFALGFHLPLAVEEE